MIKRYPVALVLLSLLLAGCARPHVQLNRVLVYNATTSKVTEVKLRHEPTMKVGAVSAILPGKSLDIGFPQQPMLASKGVLGWRDGDGKLWQVELSLPYDARAAEQAQAMTLIYRIAPFGQASVSIQ